MITHNHLIYQAKVDCQILGDDCEKLLKQFLLNLVSAIEMSVLIKPQVKISQANAWTGIVGIVTSHIAFHYWTIEQYVQLDIYSCKPFDKVKAISFISEFLHATEVNALFINRQMGKDFQIDRI